MESSKYFNLSQYSTLKAKDDTLPMVWEDTKLKGWRRTENRNNQTDRDYDGVYMNFNPSEFLQGLMHLKNQLPSPTLIKWKVITSVIQQLPEHKTYLLNKKLLGWGDSKWTWGARRESKANIARELWQVSGWIIIDSISVNLFYSSSKREKMKTSGGTWGISRW